MCLRDAPDARLVGFLTILLVCTVGAICPVSAQKASSPKTDNVVFGIYPPGLYDASSGDPYSISPPDQNAELFGSNYTFNWRAEGASGHLIQSVTAKNNTVTINLDGQLDTANVQVIGQSWFHKGLNRGGPGWDVSIYVPYLQSKRIHVTADLNLDASVAASAMSSHPESTGVWGTAGFCRATAWLIHADINGVEFGSSTSGDAISGDTEGHRTFHRVISGDVTYQEPGTARELDAFIETDKETITNDYGQKVQCLHFTLQRFLNWAFHNDNSLQSDPVQEGGSWDGIGSSRWMSLEAHVSPGVRVLCTVKGTAVITVDPNPQATVDPANIFISGAGERTFSKSPPVQPYRDEFAKTHPNTPRVYAFTEGEAVRTFISSLKPNQRINIIGHSAGAETAALVAKGCGRKVNLLITIDPDGANSDPRDTKHPSRRVLNLIDGIRAHVDKWVDVRASNGWARGADPWDYAPKEICSTFIDAQGKDHAEFTALMNFVQDGASATMILNGNN